MDDFTPGLFGSAQSPAVERSQNNRTLIERARRASEMRRGRAGGASAGDRNKFMNRKSQPSARARGERRGVDRAATSRHI